MNLKPLQNTANGSLTTNLKAALKAKPVDHLRFSSSKDGAVSVSALPVALAPAIASIKRIMKSVNAIRETSGEPKLDFAQIVNALSDHGNEQVRQTDEDASEKFGKALKRITGTKGYISLADCQDAFGYSLDVIRDVAKTATDRNDNPIYTDANWEQAFSNTFMEQMD